MTIFYITIKVLLFLLLLVLFGIVRKRITKGENPFPEGPNNEYKVF